jgi:CubicO group peptidase (beta-lactamase class C family)
VDDPKSGEITLRQLLTHSSGLPAGGLFDGKQDAGALEQRVRWLSGVKLNRAPGSGYEYANDGYATLGMVVQAVSGKPYQEYMAKNVFTPMGMSDTTFDPVAAAKAGLVQGYTTRAGIVTPVDTPLSSAMAPAGMHLSSARDIGNYFVSLLSGSTVVSQASLQEMWKPATPMDPSGQASYGFGWAVVKLPSEVLLAHDGSVFSAGAFFALDPVRKLVIGVLVNLENSTLDEVGQGIFMLLSGAEVPPTPARSVPPPSTFKPHTAVW